jgi:hypothetical protein
MGQLIGATLGMKAQMLQLALPERLGSPAVEKVTDRQRGGYKKHDRHGAQPK